EPTVMNLDKLQQRLDREDYRDVRKSLEDVGFGAYKAGGHSIVTDLLSTYAGQAQHLKDWCQDAQINRDKNLRLQYLAGMWLNSYIGRHILTNMLEHFRFPEETFPGSPERVQALRQALDEAGRTRHMKR